MKRRNFLEKTLATSGALLVPAASVAAVNNGAGKNEMPIDKNDHETIFDEVIIERPVSGKPHLGKVLAVIQPHCDDIPIFAGGTVAKLIDEGYTGYLIRTTNDDAAGSGKNYGEVVANNEADTEAVARVLGLKKTYHLNYRNHNMDENNIQEIKARKGKVIAVVSANDTLIKSMADHVMEVPEVDELLAPLLSVIPTQLLSYYIGVKLGLDVDKPRNLAKSVTVE
jgi:hypothetical protein